MDVYRTLVVGMGSCGAQVINEILQRVNWEYGGLDKTPWLRVQCFETDPGKRGIIPHEFYTPLAITADRYSTIVTKLRNGTLEETDPWLSPWLDVETLQAMPALSVQAGAGGNRMVGRLTFFENFPTIKGIINNHLTRLDNVSGGQIKDEPVAMMPNTRVFVVGSLCGGTCSGSCSDIGFLLHMLQAHHIPGYTYGIFTIPFPEDARLPAVERLKTNAIHAIKELYTYSTDASVIVKRPNWGFIFPDGSSVNNTLTPYDLTFLVRPKSNVAGNDIDGLKLMHNSIAERIYLNIFEPVLDTHAKAVDTGTGPFCTFGISSMMYPSFQIAEACACYAEKGYFTGLASKYTGDATVPDVLTPLGAQRSVLNLYNQHTELAKMAATDGRENCHLRSTRIRNKSQDVCNLYLIQVWNELRQSYESCLRNVDSGLNKWMALLDAILDDSTGINKLVVPSTPPDWDAFGIDDEIPQPKGCFGFRKKDKHKGHHQLASILDDEKTHLVSLVLNTSTVSKITDQVRKLKENTRNLDSLLRLWRLDAGEGWNALSTKTPDIQGVALFEPVAGDKGTAWGVMNSIYALHNNGVRSTDIQHAILEKTNPEMIKLLLPWIMSKTFPVAPMSAGEAELATPVPTSAVPDWVAQEKQEYHISMTRFFTHPQSVLELWDMLSDGAKSDHAVQVAVQSKHMLDVSTVGTLHSPGLYHLRFLRSPLTDPDIISRYVDKVSPNLPMALPPTDADSSDPNRATILQEVLKFHPLRMISLPNYMSAECIDFKSFHTRKDVVWQGLTTEEFKRDLKAAEILAVSMLLGVVYIHGGYLKYKPGNTGIPELDLITLPSDMDYAARLLAINATDVHGNSLRGVGLEWMSMKINEFKDQQTLSADDFWKMHIITAINNRVGVALPCWDSSDEQRDYLSAMHRLAKGFMVHHSDPELVIQGKRLMKSATADSLRKTTGDDIARLQKAQRDGYYCPECGGFIGANDDEAAENGWTCTFNPSHYYGAR